MEDVCHVDELIQHIVSSLPLEEILRAKLVCRTWNKAVSDPHLWRALYQEQFAGVVMKVDHVRLKRVKDLTVADLAAWPWLYRWRTLDVKKSHRLTKRAKKLIASDGSHQVG
jgi:hypothetical protein